VTTSSYDDDDDDDDIVSNNTNNNVQLLAATTLQVLPADNAAAVSVWSRDLAMSYLATHCVDH
jgi:hypothetical protein